MSNYTTTEIEEAIERDVSGDGWEGLSDASYYSGKYYPAVTLTLRGEEVKPEFVASHGGEGEGERIWFVFKVGDQLFRKNGYYASHYGTDWDGSLDEVREAQKYITVYEAA